MERVELINDKTEIDKLRDVCRSAVQLLSYLKPFVKEGISTGELNDLCENYTVNILKSRSATLNYYGFPKSVCTSINHVVCHGIPGDKILKSGDILNVDVTLEKNGYYGDTSIMFLIGEVYPYARRLVEVAQECLYLGIKAVTPGNTTGDIGAAIQSHAESNGYSVVREYCGHGIGRSFHQAPTILHFGSPGSGLKLEPGMVFTIEPMINAGKKEIKILKDGWTVVTKDKKNSAQWEHTVLVTKGGCEVLTKRENETI